MRAARCQRWVLGGGSGSVRVPRLAAAGPRIATAARKKTLENEIQRQVLDLVQQKNDCRARFTKAAGPTEGGR